MRVERVEGIVQCVCAGLQRSVALAATPKSVQRRVGVVWSGPRTRKPSYVPTTRGVMLNRTYNYVIWRPAPEDPGRGRRRLQAWKPPRCRVLRSDSQDSEVGVVQEQGRGPHETDIYSDKPKAAVLGVAELATHAGQPTACSPLLGWQPPQRHVWK